MVIPATALAETTYGPDWVKTCNGNNCHVIQGEANYFDGSKYIPLQDVIDFTWNTENYVLDFEDGSSVTIVPWLKDKTITQGNKMRKISDWKNNKAGRTVVSRQEEKTAYTKFALNLTDDESFGEIEVGDVAFKLKDMTGNIEPLIWNDYSVTFANGVSIDFQDLVDNGFEVEWDGTDEINVGGIDISLTYLDLDPVIKLQTTNGFTQDAIINETVPKNNGDTALLAIQVEPPTNLCDFEATHTPGYSTSVMRSSNIDVMIPANTTFFNASIGLFLETIDMPASTSYDIQIKELFANPNYADGYNISHRRFECAGCTPFQVPDNVNINITIAGYLSGAVVITDFFPSQDLNNNGTWSVITQGDYAGIFSVSDPLTRKIEGIVSPNAAKNELEYVLINQNVTPSQNTFNAEDQSGDVDIYRIGTNLVGGGTVFGEFRSAWNEKRTNWNNFHYGSGESSRVNTTAESFVTISDSSTTGQYYNWTVSSMFQNAILADRKNVSMILGCDGSTFVNQQSDNYLSEFTSSEGNGAQVPLLNLFYQTNDNNLSSSLASITPPAGVPETRA